MNHPYTNRTHTRAESIAGPIPPNMPHVLGVVAANFQVDFNFAFAKSRVPRHVAMRWVCYLVCEELCDVTQAEMARYFERDRTTLAEGLLRAQDLRNPNCPDIAPAFNKRYHGQTFRAVLAKTLQHFKDQN